MSLSTTSMCQFHYSIKAKPSPQPVIETLGGRARVWPPPSFSLDGKNKNPESPFLGLLSAQGFESCAPEACSHSNGRRCRDQGCLLALLILAAVFAGEAHCSRSGPGTASQGLTSSLSGAETPASDTEISPLIGARTDGLEAYAVHHDSFCGCSGFQWRPLGDDRNKSPR